MTDTLKKDERCYGIDLLKTLAMFMVVLLHVLSSSGALDETDFGNASVAWLMEIGAYCAVNCFAMATGYLMVGKIFRYRKIVPLWVTVTFYSVVLLAVGLIFFPGSVGLGDVNTIFSVTATSYWYFSAYFGMFFFIPYMNSLIDSLSEKKFRFMLLMGFVLFSVLSVTGLKYMNPFGMGKGYCTWWLMYLYFLGAGIKKYGWFHSISARKALVGYVTMVVITLLSKIGIEFIISLKIPKITGFFMTYGSMRFVSYLSPTIVVSGVFLMLFCLKISVPQWFRKPLVWLAPLIFQVYIIHCHFVVWDRLEGWLYSYGHMPLPLMVLWVLGVTVAIFGVCVLIDWLRYQLFRLLKVNQRVDRLADKVIDLVKKKAKCL